MQLKHPKPLFFVIIGILSIILFLGIRYTSALTSNTDLSAQNVDEYMYKLRNRFLLDAVQMQFDIKNNPCKEPCNNPCNGWMEIPNLHLQGDSLRNAINPSPPYPRNIIDSTRHFNIVWYNANAAPLLKKVWCDTIPKIEFPFAYPNSTMIVQMVTVEEKIPNSISWEINVDKVGNTIEPSVDSLKAGKFAPKRVWLRNIDMSFKDSKLGWVYMAFRYDSTNTINHGCTTCTGKYAGLENLVAIGASWKTTKGITTIFSPHSDTMLIKPFVGKDNQLTALHHEKLSCAYCHSAAQWNVNNDSLNNPRNLSELFTEQIYDLKNKLILRNENIDLLFKLNTQNHAYCDNSNLENTLTKALLDSICQSPGPNWKSLDDDLLLTVTLARELGKKPD